MTNLQEKNDKFPDFAYKVSVAPMLDRTDKHFRYFIRLICRRPLLYTEMIAAPALILGNRHKLLDYNETEHPLALQIGTCDASLAGKCAVFAREWGYDEINLNAGCPSSRVQSGAFGAVLMKKPDLAADCVNEMAQSGLPVTVKTRIALSDAPNGFEALFSFAEQMKRAGCSRLIVHARRAKLNLSPKDNRSVHLPIDYETVYRLKKSFPDMPVIINGDIVSLTAAEEHLKQVDGVMLGRMAYGNPYALSTVDLRFYHDDHPILTRAALLKQMLPYLIAHADSLSVICPHLMGLYHGCENAKIFRQILVSKDLNSLKKFIEVNLPYETNSAKINQ